MADVLEWDDYLNGSPQIVEDARDWIACIDDDIAVDLFVNHGEPEAAYQRYLDGLRDDAALRADEETDMQIRWAGA